MPQPPKEPTAHLRWNRISLNSAAYDLIGRATHVRLDIAWSPDRILLTPVPATDADAVAVRSYRTSHWIQPFRLSALLRRVGRPAIPPSVWSVQLQETTLVLAAPATYAMQIDLPPA
jgi:hypothetical protein